MKEQLYRKQRISGNHSCTCWYTKIHLGFCWQLTPVEPCNHGNYAQHIVDSGAYSNVSRVIKWCPGESLGN